MDYEGVELGGEVEFRARLGKSLLIWRPPPGPLDFLL